MAGWTNKGKYRVLDMAFRNSTEPTNLYVALVTSAAAPAADTNTFSQLTEITANTSLGYQSGGFQLARNGTDFDSLVENDTDDRGDLQIKDVSWSHATEAIPRTGNGARWAVLTDDNVTVGSREVYCFWDLTTDRSVSATQTLKLENLELRLTE